MDVMKYKDKIDNIWSDCLINPNPNFAKEPNNIPCLSCRCCRRHLREETDKCTCSLSLPHKMVGWARVHTLVETDSLKLKKCDSINLLH